MENVLSMICFPRGDDQIKSDVLGEFEPGSLAESRRATPDLSNTLSFHLFIVSLRETGKNKKE